ncbi:MAG: aminoglycoside phosphotransferase, partial [Candidatus Dormibacteraceae bacterium]
MITGKVNWEAIRHVIEQETGTARIIKQISEGRNSEISVIVHTDADAIFVKGRKVDHPQAWTQEREKTINPSVLHLSPWLKWSISSDEWNLLGFEYLAGRHVDYSPGSPDIPKVMHTLLELQQISCPGITLKHAEQRWAAYTDTPELFTGTYLLHTDWSPGNVLVNGRTYLVDWAWPTKGAGWIDPACLAVWLIASGHSPASAESWAARIPSWGSASRNALDEFARVQ